MQVINEASSPKKLTPLPDNSIAAADNVEFYNVNVSSR